MPLEYHLPLICASLREQTIAWRSLRSLSLGVKRAIRSIDGIRSVIRTRVCLFVIFVIFVIFLFRQFFIGRILIFVRVPHAVDKLGVGKAKTRFVDELDVLRLYAFYYLKGNVSSAQVMPRQYLPSLETVACGTSTAVVARCRIFPHFCCGRAAPLERECSDTSIGFA